MTCPGISNRALGSACPRETLCQCCGRLIGYAHPFVGATLHVDGGDYDVKFCRPCHRALPGDADLLEAMIEKARLEVEAHRAHILPAVTHVLAQLSPRKDGQ